MVVRKRAAALAAAAAVSAAGVLAPNAAAGSPPWERDYELVVLDPGGASSAAVDINDKGQVAGTSISGGIAQAVVWDVVRGTRTDTGSYAGSFRSTAINEKGLVVGNLSGAEAPSAFAWRPDGGAPQVQGSWAYSTAEFVNDRGEAAILVSDSTVPGPGGIPTDLVLWDTRTGSTAELGFVDEFDLLGAMNRRAQIVGTDTDAFIVPEEAIIWDGRSGIRRTIDNAAANDINDRGQIAGQLGGVATVWNRHLESRAIATPGAYSDAQLVNRRGQVAGQWSADRFASTRQAFFWDPVRDVATDIGTDVYPQAMNDVGQVVGLRYSPGEAPTTPVVWDRRSGMVTELDLGPYGAAGWSVGNVDINNRGQISMTAYRSGAGSDDSAALVFVRGK